MDSQNLRGRYYPVPTLAVAEVNGLDTRLKVGFEDAKDKLFYFAFLKYN